MKDWKKEAEKAKEEWRQATKEASEARMILVEKELVEELTGKNWQAMETRLMLEKRQGMAET